ncbi:MAG TPA: hypothetical protein VM575_07445 [Nocardioides sp.]|nr:hypothetical protein [Nocardioides sp.]
MIATRIPHGRTARRVEWAHLPPAVRDAVEARLGAPVAEAVSQGAGFTPGFASVLTCTDGSRHFVKAASVRAQRLFADSYREEARKLGMLPAGTPAPRLLWTDEVAEWFLLGIEYVEARAPHRPWTEADLASASAMAVEMAAQLTPAPDGLGSATDEFASWPGLWAVLDHPRAAEIGALAARYAEVVTGDTLVHTDIRDDNLLVLDDGRTLLCDWNWPVVGAPWLDSLFLLIGPRGDGLDVEAHIAGHPLLGGVPAEHVDVVLALILGYFAASANEPVPPTSPHIRAAQAWQRDVIDQWLSERRGWDR